MEFWIKQIKAVPGDEKVFAESVVKKKWKWDTHRFHYSTHIKKDTKNVCLIDLRGTNPGIDMIQSCIINTAICICRIVAVNQKSYTVHTVYCFKLLVNYIDFYCAMCNECFLLEN